jgi:hypothetical protein
VWERGGGCRQWERRGEPTVESGRRRRGLGRRCRLVAGERGDKVARGVMHDGLQVGFSYFLFFHWIGSYIDGNMYRIIFCNQLQNSPTLYIYIYISCYHLVTCTA